MTAIVHLESLEYAGLYACGIFDSRGVRTASHPLKLTCIPCLVAMQHRFGPGLVDPIGERIAQLRAEKTK